MKAPLNENKNHKTSQKNLQQEYIEKEYLILLGGNSHDPESESNVTGEFVEMDKIHYLVNQRRNLSIDI